MSRLSEAVDNVAQAAEDLRETAAALRAITERADKDLLPASVVVAGRAKRLLSQADDSLDGVEGKVTALLGRVGALTEKATTIACAVRDGAWIELEEVSFGGELRMSGRVRITPPDGAGNGRADG